jgi:hypothetical protein
MGSMDRLAGGCQAPSTGDGKDRFKGFRRFRRFRRFKWFVADS